MPLGLLLLVPPVIVIAGVPRLLERGGASGIMGTVLTPVLSGVLMIAATGNASVSFLMLGGLCHAEYIERGLETKNCNAEKDRISIEIRSF